MAAVRHLEFLKLNVVVIHPLFTLFLRSGTKVKKIAQCAVEIRPKNIFSIRRPSAVFRFRSQNFRLSPILLQHAKCHQSRINLAEIRRCNDFQIEAVRHLEFLKFRVCSICHVGRILRLWITFRANWRIRCWFRPIGLNIVLARTIFSNKASFRHLEFKNLGASVTWFLKCHMCFSTQNLIKIGLFLTEMRRYNDIKILTVRHLEILTFNIFV